MAVDTEQELYRLRQYVQELETSRETLSIENERLRNSRSYRLGRALGSFAKQRRLRAIRGIFEALKPRSGDAGRNFLKRVRPNTSATRGDFVDALERMVELPPTGSLIAERARFPTLKIVGIIRPELSERLGDCVLDGAIRYDRYDLEWGAQSPSHLIVDVDEMPSRFGWNYALTVHDAASTIELTAMLQKARSRGIKTVLLLPIALWQFPLLSRVRGLFDLELKVSELIEEDAEVLLGTV